MGKNIKRLISLLLVTAMVFTITTIAYATVSNDAQNSSYKDSIEVLNALQIMVGDEKGNFNPTNKITRAEFAKVAVSTMGLDKLAEASNHPTKFKDVGAYFWGNSYINAASTEKIMVGDEKGNFNPFSEITYTEVMAILVRIAGYESVAQDRGGWPTGYLNVGKSLGIGEDVSLSANTAVTREQVAKMTENCLYVKVMKQIGFDENVSYEIKNVTVMEDKLNATKTEGILTATQYASISGTITGIGKFKVGNTILKTDDNLNNMLGNYAEVYAKNGKSVLIRSVDNTDLSINSRDITTVSAINKKVTITYGTSGKKLNFYLDKVTYLKDCKNTTLTTGNLDVLKEGTILKAIDNNKDGIFDVLLTTTQRDIVVKKASVTSGLITDKLGNPSIRLDSDVSNITITKDGKAITLADIKEYDILTVIEGYDDSFIDVRVSDKKIAGKISEKYSSKYVINGITYEAVPSFTSDISIGETGTFYLDVDGKIAAADVTVTLSTNYAYLVDIAMDNFNTHAKFILFTKSGKKVEVSSEESIKLNGAKKSASEVFNALTKEGKVVQQLLTYETNTSSNISEINLPQKSSGIDEEAFLLNDQLDNAVYQESKDLFGKYGVSTSTIVFNIPYDSTKIEDFSVTNRSFFEDEMNYDALVYNVNGDNDAGIILVTNVSYKTASNAPLAFVEKVTQTSTDDGTVDRLYATVNGQEVIINAEGGDFLKKGSGQLEQGDIIQYKTNNKGEIVDFRLVFDIHQKETEKEQVVNDNLTIKYGRVTGVNSTTLGLSVNGGESETLHIGAAKVYRMSADGIVTETNLSDISKYDSGNPTLVLAKMYKDSATEVVIVEQGE